MFHPPFSSVVAWCLLIWLLALSPVIYLLPQHLKAKQPLRCSICRPITPLHDLNWTDFGSKVPPSACVWYSRLVWVGSKWSLYRRSPLSHDKVIFLEGLHSPLLYEPVAVLPGSWMKGRSVGLVFFLISMVSLCILLLLCLLWRRVLATFFFPWSL